MLLLPVPWLTLLQGEEFGKGEKVFGTSTSVESIPSRENTPSGASCWGRFTAGRGKQPTRLTGFFPRKVWAQVTEEECITAMGSAGGRGSSTDLFWGHAHPVVVVEGSIYLLLEGMAERSTPKATLWWGQTHSQNGNTEEACLWITAGTGKRKGGKKQHH